MEPLCSTTILAVELGIDRAGEEAWQTIIVFRLLEIAATKSAICHEQTALPRDWYSRCGVWSTLRLREGCGSYRNYVSTNDAGQQQREQLGLNPIGANWQLQRDEFSEQDWKARGTDSSISKKVKRDSKGNLLWEEDYYYSGKTFTTFKGETVLEQLTVYYDYRTSLYKIGYIGASPIIEALVGELKSQPVTKENGLRVVNSVLRLWKPNVTPPSPNPNRNL